MMSTPGSYTPGSYTAAIGCGAGGAKPAGYADARLRRRRTGDLSGAVGLPRQRRRGAAVDRTGRGVNHPLRVSLDHRVGCVRLVGYSAGLRQARGVVHVAHDRALVGRTPHGRVTRGTGHVIRLAETLHLPAFDLATMAPHAVCVAKNRLAGQVAARPAGAPWRTRAISVGGGCRGDDRDAVVHLWRSAHRHRRHAGAVLDALRETA